MGINGSNAARLIAKVLVPLLELYLSEKARMRLISSAPQGLFSMARISALYFLTVALWLKVLGSSTFGPRHGRLISFLAVPIDFGFRTLKKVVFLSQSTITKVVVERHI